MPSTKAFGADGSATINYLIADTLLKAFDYFPDDPGGKTGHRSMEPEPIDGALLGNELNSLRSNIMNSNKNTEITFLDNIYENQNEWAAGTNINKINNNLKKIVKNLGISSTQFDKCLNNEVISDKILNGRINGQQKYSINSTPTIIINEKKLEGSVSFKNIQKNIEKLI